MKILGYTISKPTNYIQRNQPEKVGSFTIVEQPTQIISAEIANFKIAIQAAKGQYSQQRGMIYDMYQNAIDFDSILIGLIEQRLIATTGKKLQYLVNEEPSPQGKALTDTPLFNEFISDVVLSQVFWGMGLFEFGKKKWNNQELFDYFQIPIKHIDPYQKVVRETQYSSSQNDKPYKGIDNVLFVGEKDNFGLLQQLTMLALYKRAAINDWAKYTKLAGTNFRILKYRGAQLGKKEREGVLDKVSNFAGGAVDLPQDIDLTTENQTSSSQNALFENYVAYLDEQMTKIVLGSTMTTSDGSSRSQAEVHERTTETLLDADSAMLLNVLNYDFYEIGVKMYGLPEGGRWSYIENAGTKQLEQIEMDLKLKELGLLFTNEEIRAKYL